MAVEEGQLEVEAQDEWFGGNAGGVGSTPQGTFSLCQPLNLGLPSRVPI
jgi:hypothetical protein